METRECARCNIWIESNHLGDKAPICPQCGEAMGLKTESKPGTAPIPETVYAAPKPHPYPLVFLGSAREYFRIWIVNLFLTVITLGIYAAWAKVRTRQYFYANTRLAGYQFDYLANPVAILKGNLIIAAGFVYYSIINYFAPVYNYAVFGLFALILPFLIYKSLRFYTHNSAYRNIRFRFTGSLAECYKTYLLIPSIVLLIMGPILAVRYLQTGVIHHAFILVILLILAIVYPFWAFYRKKYFLDHAAFGSTRSIFTGSDKPFYSFYIKAVLMGLGVFFLMGVCMGISSPIFIKPRVSLQATPNPPMGFVILFVVYFFIAVLLMQGIAEYLKARISNYTWSVTRLGRVRFTSTLKARELFWIQITNIMAILVSLGFLIPWAKVRRLRYVLANTGVLVPGTLDEFAAAMEVENNALGDSATDFFDLEIGF
jgi:uncharacterized membrane protein YjgN (DUF898 family)